MLISVKHNIEVAHRLYETKGKCEQIHGHSMWVTLNLNAVMGASGMARALYNRPQELEFGAIKKTFRNFLDSTYDHRLLLNSSDPFARPIFMIDEFHYDEEGKSYVPTKPNPQQYFLPGLQPVLGDPTTENIAMWIHNAMRAEGLPVASVELWETSVNRVVYP